MKDTNFLDHYIICALWSSTDADGEPLDNRFKAGDITRETRAEMAADCEAFKAMAAGLYPDREEPRAAHDFWLTRNGHGAGFWDGDWREPAASKLTEIAKSFGPFDLYVNRGRVSGSGPIKYYFDRFQGARIVRTAAAPVNSSRTGYGRKLPTSYTLIDAAGVKRRVYAICYSNAASYYVQVSGALFFIRDADIPENPDMIGGAQ